MKIDRTAWLTSLAALLVGTPALATLPYTPVAPEYSALGPGVAPPDRVSGKEYSHDFDHTTAGAGGAPDAQQIVAWDGSGGTADGQDFTGTRPDWTPDQEIDAIANHADYLFNPLRRDTSHLIFTHDDEVAFYDPAGGYSLGGVPAGGPVALTNGNVIGGAGEVSIELSGAYNGFEKQGPWAPLPAVNGSPLPRDIDGLEVWGPEPAFTADADKYSLDLDFVSGVSVWNGSGSAYIDHGTIVSAVELLLGPIPGPAILPFDNQESTNAINVDALMVQDLVGSGDRFDGDPAGGAQQDRIIFSIRQILDPADSDGYYSTGSELFVLDGAGGVSFLDHGGHVWDHGYALGAFGLVGPAGNDLRGVIDINGIESITQVPEPACLLLLVGGMASVVTMRCRLG